MTIAARLILSLVPFAAFAGCQQRMADQPAPRPYEESPHFAYKQSARPLEVGVVHRGQRAESDPLVTGLSDFGRKMKPGDFSGNAAYSKDSVLPPTGAPNDEKNFVSEFPFPMTESDLKRGQQRYNVFCALCHGAAGEGNGKIAERGYLRPPSYHQDLEGIKKDWSTGTNSNDQKPKDTDAKDERMPQGYSRGFARYEKFIALDKVPVGYIFQVITWGYGGMASHASQIPADDRWRITAYVRALQMSQSVPAAQLSPEQKDSLDGKIKPKSPDHN